jgi:hypothetical protein
VRIFFCSRISSVARVLLKHPHYALEIVDFLHCSHHLVLGFLVHLLVHGSLLEHVHFRFEIVAYVDWKVEEHLQLIDRDHDRFRHSIECFGGCRVYKICALGVC